MGEYCFLNWHRYIPRIGDLIILEYHRGRRVGIFIRRTLKFVTDDADSSAFATVWEISWIPVEDEKSPSPVLTELTILHYLKSGKAKIYRRKNENCT